MSRLVLAIAMLAGFSLPASAQAAEARSCFDLVGEMMHLQATTQCAFPDWEWQADGKARSC